jgi:Leucine-rich repeat (LRR) protein
LFFCCFLLFFEKKKMQKRNEMLLRTQSEYPSGRASLRETNDKKSVSSSSPTDSPDAQRKTMSPSWLSANSPQRKTSQKKKAALLRQHSEGTKNSSGDDSGSEEIDYARSKRGAAGFLKYMGGEDGEDQEVRKERIQSTGIGLEARRRIDCVVQHYRDTALSKREKSEKKEDDDHVDDDDDEKNDDEWDDGESLVLNDLSLESVAPVFAELEQAGCCATLRRLDLSSNQIDFVPRSIGQFKQLESLSIESNMLRTLPSEFGEMGASLERLHLYNNRISVLPSSVGRLVGLRRLYLDNNQLVTLPIELELLTNLTLLSLDNNRLKKIPPSVAGCVKLEWLSADNNRLTMLPPELLDVPALQVVSVLNNGDMVHVPAALGRRPDLTFRYNGCCTVPPDMLPRQNSRSAADIQLARLIFDYLQYVVAQFGLRFDAKAHWQPDSNASKCTRCIDSFTITKRRHHCRLCGRLFCKKCCSKTMNLPVLGSSRICDDCFSCLAQEHADRIDRDRLFTRPDDLSLMIEELTGMPAMSPSEFSSMEPLAKRNFLQRQLEVIDQSLELQQNSLTALKKLTGGASSASNAPLGASSEMLTSAATLRARQQIEEANDHVKTLAAAQARIHRQLESL